MDVLLSRLSDAWAWLEAHALIGPSAQNPQSGNWQRLTALGDEILQDPNAVAKVWAADRLAGDLHPALSSARSNFALGDFETASFAAMKAVEVEVRRVAGLPNELIGVPLMRKAFGPRDGVLCDPGAEGGEQQVQQTCSLVRSGHTRIRRVTERCSSTIPWRPPKLFNWRTYCYESCRGPLGAGVRDHVKQSCDL